MIRPQEHGLAVFYADYFRVVYLQDPRHPRSAKTIADYDAAVRDYVRITGDPPLEEIDQGLGDALVESLMNLPGKRPGSIASPETVRKKCRTLQTLLKFLGPPVSRSTRRAAGIFPQVPCWLDPPDPLPPRVDKAIRRDELEAWLKATDSARMTLPVLDPPPVWWRTLLAVLYYTGLRIETALALRYSWIDGQWLKVPAAGMKGRRRPGRFWLSPLALEQLESFRRPDRDRVFSWPHYSRGSLTLDANRPAARRAIDRERVRQHAEAGIREGLGFHSIRDLVAELLWQVDPVAAQFALGHTTAKTTATHYVGGEAKAAVIDRALPALPAGARLRVI